MAISNITIAIVLASFLVLTNSCVAMLIPKNNHLEYLVPQNMVRAVKLLPPLVWNETVAQFAGEYAKQRSADCLLEHSHSEVYGENIAMSTGDMTPSEAIKMWAGEKPDYDYNTNTCTGGKMCGHYTQIVWRDTKSIGCAEARCQNGGTFITCNYYPPGNYIGEKPF